MMWLLRRLGPLGWTLAVIVPTLYAVAYVIEDVYEVPLDATSIRFEHPWAALVTAAALLVLALRGWLLRHAAPRLRVSHGALLATAQPSWRMRLRQLPTGLRTNTTLLLAIALMGPQSIHARDRTEVEGIDIVLTLDLSLSMRAADIRPNRAAATKDVVDDFIRRRPNDRIGAVIFGREAYTLLPLTTDKDSLRQMVSELQLGVIDGLGTAIGNAVAVSLNRLRRSNAKSKVIILLTDGQSNSGNVAPEQAAQFAQSMGVKIYTVLMGEADDAPVQRGIDLFGQPLMDTGNYPVNPELLQAMATRSGGEYFRVSDRDGLVRSFHAILDRLERSEIEDLGRVYGELFPAFVAPALVLLALELAFSVFVVRRWP